MRCLGQCVKGREGPASTPRTTIPHTKTFDTVDRSRHIESDHSAPVASSLGASHPHSLGMTLMSEPFASSPLSRRSFLATVAAGSIAPAFVPSRCFGANEKVTLGFIGVGGQGKGNLGGFLKQPTSRRSAMSIPSDWPMRWALSRRRGGGRKGMPTIASFWSGRTSMRSSFRPPTIGMRCQRFTPALRGRTRTSRSRCR